MSGILKMPDIEQPPPLYPSDGSATSEKEKERKKKRKKKKDSKKVEIEDPATASTYMNPSYSGYSLATANEEASTSAQPIAVVMPSRSHNCNTEDMEEFIANHISARVCKEFVKNERVKDPNTTFCMCMRTEEWHRDRNIPEKPGSSWKPATSTQQISTNAHGHIKLHGYGRVWAPLKPKYIRVDALSKEFEHIWTLMTKYWEIPKPHLILSINGGAKKMAPMSHRLKTALKQGLINVSSSTTTWITTGGFHLGVAQLVGEASRDYLLSADPSQNFLVVLGIATWGAVYNRDLLEVDHCTGEVDEGIFHVANYYNSKENPGKGQASLDPHHTHFILCDDGTERAFGKEIDFKTHFEKFISNKVIESGVSASPVVQLIIEGGKKAIKTCYVALLEDIPCVVMKGSGRAADVICIVVESVNKDDDWDTAMTEIVPLLDKYKVEWSLSDKEYQETQQYLFDMAKKFSDLIHVFNMDGVTKELDRAILLAVFKSSKEVSTQSLLSLAMSMNRCDLAAQEIFSATNKTKWKKLDLELAMHEALRSNLVSFVELFLDHGISMDRFLSRDRLQKLYLEALFGRRDRSLTRSIELLRQVMESHLTPWYTYIFRGCRKVHARKAEAHILENVGNVIQLLTGDAILSVYSMPDKLEVEDTQKSVLMSGNIAHQNSRQAFNPVTVTVEPPHNTPLKRAQTSMMYYKREVGTHTYYYPSYPPRSPDGQRLYTEQDLFLWSLLLNRIDLAKVFWKIGKDHIGSALVATAILNSLRTKAESDGELELAIELQASAEFFETTAVGILAFAYSRDKDLAHLMLIRALPYWSNQTCLALAYQNECMEFLYNTASQTKLNRIWMGGMSPYTSTWRIGINLVFAPLFIRLIFAKEDTTKQITKENQISPHDESPREDGGLMKPERISTDAPTSREDREILSAETAAKKMSPRQRKSFLDDFRSRQQAGWKNVSFFKAIRLFYTAPITKFMWNIVFYVVFVCLFTYFLLVTLKPITVSGQPSIPEIIIWVWSFTLFVEEIRQVLRGDHRSLRYKVKDWFSSSWNRFDLALYSLHILAIILRLVVPTEHFIWSRMTYSVVLSMFFIRFMQFYYAHRFIGPKVVMVRRMLNDVVFFLCIYLIFLLAYGTLAHALQHPNHPPSWSLLKNIVYQPYWQTYGELSLTEQVEGDMTCAANDYACTHSSPLVIVSFALFMLFTNVLLLNLLIAMFGNTFEKVQSSSEKVWAYNRFDLIHEYYDRPFLAPPLIIFVLIFRFIRFFYKRCEIRCQHKQLQKDSTDFKVYLEMSENIEISGFEEQCMELYIVENWEDTSASSVNTLKEASEKLDEVMEQVSSIKGSLDHVEQHSHKAASEMVLSSRVSGLRSAPVATDTDSPKTSQPMMVQSRNSDVNDQLVQDVAYLKNSMSLLEGRLSTQTEQMDRMLQLLSNRANDLPN